MTDGPWITEEMGCPFCGHEWTCIHPACEEVECSACHRMIKTHFLETLLQPQKTYLHWTENNVGYTMPTVDSPLIPKLQAFLDQHSKPLTDPYA